MQIQSTLRKMARAGVVGFLALAAFLPSAAHADGKVTWKNYWTARYLEVYQKSQDNGALVGNWPWTGGDNQYWYDSVGDDGYWIELNWNSFKMLDGYNSDCSVHQYGDTTPPPPQRLWRELHVDASIDGAGWVWHLINKKGCLNDPYHDSLSTPDDDSVYNVIMRPEDWTAGGCGMPNQIVYNLRCSWK